MMTVYKMRRVSWMINLFWWVILPWENKPFYLIIHCNILERYIIFDQNHIIISIYKLVRLEFITYTVNKHNYHLRTADYKTGTLTIFGRFWTTIHTTVHHYNKDQRKETWGEVNIMYHTQIIASILQQIVIV